MCTRDISASYAFIRLLKSCNLIKKFSEVAIVKKMARTPAPDMGTNFNNKEPALEIWEEGHSWQRQ